MQYLYSNGKYQSTDRDNVSTMTQAFNYGTAAFEGMKAFYLEDRRNWFLFRPDQHYQRLLRSAAMLDIELEMSLDEFVGTIATLIKKNNIRTDVYIRPIVYRSQKGVGLNKPSGYGVSIFIQSTPHSSSNRFKCCFVSQRRPVDGTFSGKLTGNYLLSYFSSKEALERGYQVGILLSSEGYVSEASVMNLFFASDGKLFTPSLECGALDGITRKSVIQIAREELGLDVREGKYRQRRLLDADEILFTGTGSGINYVHQLEKRKFNAQSKEQMAIAVARVFEDVTHGRVGGYSDWLVPVL